jgi:hypothetical protein
MGEASVAALAAAADIKVLRCMVLSPKFKNNGEVDEENYADGFKPLALHWH